MRIHVKFKQGNESFEDSRTSKHNVPNAVKKIYPLFKTPFIIRDYELRKFVQEDQYSELVKMV